MEVPPVGHGASCPKTARPRPTTTTDREEGLMIGSQSLSSVRLAGRGGAQLTPGARYIHR
jgi:hypothetical protein